MSAPQSVQQHYNTHLGSIYSWTLGDTETAYERSRDFLKSVGVLATKGQLAVDLGCGFGLHSIPVAQLGYQVVAIDLCPELLQALRAWMETLPIVVVEADLMEFDRYLSAKPNLVVCLGDTLTHLDSLESVQALLAKISSNLASGGRLILTFRDYVGTELKDSARFIPVRSTDERILTCFLEYCDNSVIVHDLVHERTPSGWQQRVSSYRKLRLNRDWVATILANHGISVVRHEIVRGMVTIVGEKPEKI